ncbi:MAG: hypothetical protein ACI976_000603 [Aureispira sp.]
MEKNNERILKKISIDYLFQELPQNNFEIFFFLVEIAPTELPFSEVLEQLEKSLNTNFSSIVRASEFMIEDIQHFFDSLSLPSICLLKETLSTLNYEFKLCITNDSLSLDATLKIHL